MPMMRDMIRKKTMIRTEKTSTIRMAEKRRILHTMKTVTMLPGMSMKRKKHMANMMKTANRKTDMEKTFRNCCSVSLPPATASLLLFPLTVCFP